jgi:hypothetical protein
MSLTNPTRLRERMMDNDLPGRRERAELFLAHALLVLTLLLTSARTVTAQTGCPAPSPNESYHLNSVAAIFTAAQWASTRTQLGIATQRPTVTKQLVTDPIVCNTNYNRVKAQVPSIWALPPNYTSAQMLAGYTLRSYRIGDYTAVLMISTPGVRGTAPLLIFNKQGQYLGVVHL